MIELVVGPASAGSIRLAISPLEDVLAVVRALTAPHRHPAHLPWLTSTRPTLDDLDAPELVELITGEAYFPDFLSPPPAGPAGTVDEQLHALAGTPEHQVALEIGMAVANRAVSPGVRAMLDDPVAARGLLAEQMRRCFDRVLAPVWPRLRAVLDADIDYRSRRFAEGGIGRVLTDLHHSVRYSGTTLVIGTRHRARRELDGRGLLLVPSGFYGHVGAMLVPPWQPALVYPVRGAGSLWHRETPLGTDTVAGVVGTMKAKLLRALAEPASTTALAARFGVAPSTVSEHLRALAAAGLLVSARSGRTVHYRRTQLGDALTCA